jgi:hypothetical protein
MYHKNIVMLLGGHRMSAYFFGGGLRLAYRGLAYRGLAYMAVILNGNFDKKT